MAITTPTLNMSRKFYRRLIEEAVEAGIVTDAADFNARALVGVTPAARAAARAGDEDAIVHLTDTAEAWLDAQLKGGDDPDDGPTPEEEAALHRQVQWNRECDYRAERGYSF